MSVGHDAHPERQYGEQFLTNCASETDFDEIGWMTKRLGKTAYDTSGKAISGLRPVFVWKLELQRAGLLEV